MSSRVKYRAPKLLRLQDAINWRSAHGDEAFFMCSAGGFVNDVGDCLSGTVPGGGQQCLVGGTAPGNPLGAGQSP